MEEAKFPDLAGREAAEGTVFHHFAAVCLEQERDPQDFIGRRMAQTFKGADGQVKTEEIVFDEEMADAMLPALDALLEEAAHPAATLYVERRVDLSKTLGEKAFGTADAIIINIKDRRMLVFDWKYGRGVPVGPTENKQGLLYALGAWDEYAPQSFKDDPASVTIEIWIEQPRCHGGGGRWECNGATLLRWRKRFAEAAARTRVENPEHNPGPDQCMWCNAQRVCDARNQFLLDLVNADYDELTDTATFGEDTGPISPELRAAILRSKKMIEKWLEQLHADAISDLLLGREVPGLKLVEGRKGPRHIPVAVQPDAEDIAEEIFGDLPFRRKLKPITRLEKELGDAFMPVLGRFVKQRPPKPILVPEDDERPSITAAVDMFTDDDVS